MDYNDLVTQVTYELGDSERRQIYPQGSDEMIRQLLELCLCILQLRSKARVSETDITFPSSEPFGLFDYIPIVDMHKIPELSLPDIMLLLSVRDASRRELSQGSLAMVRYFSDSLTGTVATPTEYYRVLTNLLGVRKAPAADVTVRLTYVPYLEINALNNQWPLDDYLLQQMLHLIRCLLFARIGRYELAKQELKDFTLYAQRNRLS